MPNRPLDPARKRFFLVAGLFAFGAVATMLLPLLLSAPIEGASYARRVSLELGDWMGTEQVVSEDTVAILGTDDVVDRHYVKEGEPWVDMAIVFAQEQRKVAHPQEICLKGAGYSIQSYSRPEVPTGLTDPAQISVVRLQIERGNKRHLVYYWYKCGNHYTSSYYRENALIIWSQLTLRPANGALIKLTTPIDEDLASSEKRLQDFLTLVMPEITSKLP